jgi:hypothetical protein
MISPGTASTLDRKLQKAQQEKYCLSYSADSFRLRNLIPNATVPQELIFRAFERSNTVAKKSTFPSVRLLMHTIGAADKHFDIHALYPKGPQYVIKGQHTVIVELTTNISGISILSLSFLPLVPSLLLFVPFSCFPFGPIFN